MLARLTKQDLDTIRAHKPILMHASEACSIPWQALASIWYRESSLRELTNAFQFDPIPSRNIIFSLLREHCNLTIPQKAEILNDGIEQFYSGALIAACWLCQKCTYDLASNHTETAIADAFYGYNGRAYGHNPLNSPYVANEIDDHHHQMHFRGTINGKWVELVDKRPGALAVYRQLTQTDPPTQSGPPSGSPPSLTVVPRSTLPGAVNQPGS
jgi:lysozyme family protein